MFIDRALKRLRRKETRTSFIAANKRVYAVGDIHGRLDLLEEMLEKITDDRHSFSGECEIIFLGDYINRGPESAQVLTCLSSLSRRSTMYRFLMGNHEEIFLRILNQNTDIFKLFLHMGGRQTILSYGVDTDLYRTASYDDLADIMRSRIPSAHMEFLNSLETQISIDDYLFVHAGVDVHKAIDNQDPKVTRWIRNEFTHSHDSYEKTVVYGHTVYPDVYQRGCRIGIDTGAYASGKLSAIALEGTRRWLLQTCGR